METAQVLALICATLTPGAMRSTSGSVVAPERRISSWLITKTAAAVRASFCSFLETEMTCTWRSCSRLASERPLWLQAEAAAATTSSRDRDRARARSIGLYSKSQSAEMGGKFRRQEAHGRGGSRFNLRSGPFDGLALRSDCGRCVQAHFLAVV